MSKNMKNTKENETFKNYMNSKNIHDNVFNVSEQNLTQISNKSNNKTAKNIRKKTITQENVYVEAKDLLCNIKEMLKYTE